ncbi:MAG: hypothetical protein HQL65_02145 [Magnetococcales bacterium]|nr:hypothetical protein [Magnetococcales bacterium]
MENRDHFTKQNFKYGAFQIRDGIGYWNGDPAVQINMQTTSSKFCIMEGIWNPDEREIISRHPVAVAGLCIWGKYDCIVKFQKIGKGNPSAERSLSNPKDRADVLKRVINKQEIREVVISKHPFGDYQSNMIAWQAETVQRFQINRLYYALPIEEYTAILDEIKTYIPEKLHREILDLLNNHYDQLKNKIINSMDAEVEFLYPMRNEILTPEESYVWPYQNLKIDLGIEDLDEVHIPYQARKNGAHIPPILLGVLGIPYPYYERRDPTDIINIVP